MFKHNKESEDKIQAYWLSNDIPKKFKSANKFSKKKYYMMDGPPYATGRIHLGTALNKTLKDVSVRYKTMRGYDVFARAGYDTHGLPIEQKVEKELGIKDKLEIENKIGVDKFISHCVNFATEHISSMNKQFDDLAIWMDFENPYYTLDPSYIEGLWTTFKIAHEKGLLYKGLYPVHVSTVFGTAVAYNEVVHKEIEDTSVYVKFKLNDKENEYLIIWTTTPWSLPGNVAVMVNPDFEYAKVETNGEVWVIAKELVEPLFKKLKSNYKISKVVLGKELAGQKYTSPLAKNLNIAHYDKIYEVILSKRYVSIDAGTGLVHCAPGHGKEDFEEGQKNKLPVLSPLDINGRFQSIAGKYEGLVGRDASPHIISDLKSDNLLVLEEKIRHEYPTCWRSEKPLLMIALPQWFFKVSAIKNSLIEQNKSVNWVPKWGEDRFANWLENLSDWPVSRNRYWGTPLPIWECEKCSHYDVFGTYSELESKLGAKIEKTMLGVHRPIIDSYNYKCSKCNSGTMRRVKDVLDVWFDSGATSWGALNYPHTKEGFEKYFPADINIEGKDQFRGWWNSQAILGEMTFEKIPFKNVMIHGMVLDINKREMHKSWGNTIAPEEVAEKHSRDLLRYFLVKESRGEDFAFGYPLFKDSERFINLFGNIVTYAKTYMNVDINKTKLSSSERKSLKVEDLWILSRLNSVIKESIDSYESYKFYKVPQLLEDFISIDFSRNYMKLAKEREDKDTVNVVMSLVLSNSIRLLAPITPHLSEQINLEFSKDSIHLSQIDDADNSLIDTALEENFKKMLDITTLALKLREDRKLRLRWTLPQINIESKLELSKFKAVLESILNVDDVSFSSPKYNAATIESEDAKISVPTEFSSDVQNLWLIQEIRRVIQDERKNLKFSPSDVKSLDLFVPQEIFAIAQANKKSLESETNTQISVNTLNVSNDSSKLFEVMNYKIVVRFN